MFPAQAIYLHIPFCRAKCHYCNFVSYAGLNELHDRYVEALKKEISRARPEAPITTIYFGGGTPTLLSERQLMEILRAIQSRFEVTPDTEITLEANPGTVDLPKLQALRLAGFNRLSLGVQSFDPTLLSRLGRIHTVKEALEAYQSARNAGFSNIGLDLMYALPGQSLLAWQRTLEQAIRLNPEHISLYELSIEEGTKLAADCQAGKLELPSEDLQIEMYEAAISTLTASGYEHYEISNFARPGFRSRHNQVYWRNDSYFGFGAGAARYLGGARAKLTDSVERYIELVEKGHDPAISSETLTGRALMGETIMLGLRLREGVDLVAFRQRFGEDLSVVYGEQIAALKASGLVEIADHHLRLTHQGLLLANRVMGEFLAISD
jgi:oxygen-independent coproporphyrinogen-3 oxidase